MASAFYKKNLTMKRSFIITLALLVTLGFAACNKGTKKASANKSVKEEKVVGVNFVKSETLSDVLDRAEIENKLVFVDFYTTWCLPCKMMDQDVFPDKGIADFMNKNFLSYKVDAEKGTGPDLVYVYSVQAYPTLIFMDAKGNVIEKKEGAAYQTELRAMGQRALDSRVN